MFFCIIYEDYDFLTYFDNTQEKKFKTCIFRVALQIRFAQVRSQNNQLFAETHHAAIILSYQLVCESASLSYTSARALANVTRTQHKHKQPLHGENSCLSLPLWARSPVVYVVNIARTAT